MARLGVFWVFFWKAWAKIKRSGPLKNPVNRKIFDPKAALTSQRSGVFTIFLKYFDGTCSRSSTPKLLFELSWLEADQEKLLLVSVLIMSRRIIFSAFRHHVNIHVNFVKVKSWIDFSSEQRVQLRCKSAFSLADKLFNEVGGYMLGYLFRSNWTHIFCEASAGVLWSREFIMGGKE